MNTFRRALLKLFGVPASGFAPLDWEGEATPMPSAAPAAASPIPIGTILPFAGPDTNLGGEWLVCAGQSLRRADFDPLFAVIRTSWGVGDHPPDTFNLPDLRGRFLRGVSNGTDRDPDRDRRFTVNGGAVGDRVGSLQDDQFQTHWHQSQVAADSGGHTHTVTATMPNSGGHSHPVRIDRPGIAGTNGSKDADGGDDKFNSDPNLGAITATIPADTGMHTHPITATIANGSGAHSHPSSVTDPSARQGTDPLQHGRETRVKNAYVNWIIKVR